MATISKLTRTIEHFANELRAEIREEVLGAVSSRLKLKGGAVARVSSSLAKGEKRSPEALHKLEAQVHQFIRRRPGLGVEAIGRELGMPTRALVLPIKKLIASKQVNAKGEKRSTKYFARG